jgi:hypothetical protein
MKFEYKMFVLRDVKEVSDAREIERGKCEAAQVANKAESVEVRSLNSKRLWDDYNCQWHRIGEDYLNKFGAIGWRVISYDRGLFVMERSVE